MPGDPTIPTREELASVLNNDSRLIDAFEELFLIIPDELNALILELQGAIYSEVSPSINRLNGSVGEIWKRLNQEIQTESSDYTLLLNDSGVKLSGESTATMPDAALWKNEDKFVENAGSEQISIELSGTQTVSGVDLIFLRSNLPYPIAFMKSDGSNLILLSDRDNENLIPAVYWETQLGEQMETKFGEKLAFRV